MRANGAVRESRRQQALEQLGAIRLRGWGGRAKRVAQEVWGGQGGQSHYGREGLGESGGTVLAVGAWRRSRDDGHIIFPF